MSNVNYNLFPAGVCGQLWIPGFYTEDLCVMPGSRLHPYTQHERLITKVRQQCDFMV